MNDRLASRRGVLTGCTAVIAASLAGCLGDGTDEWEVAEPVSVAKATQYQGPSCDCCDVYADYLETNISGELEVAVVDDLATVKEQYGIPSGFRSCHTVTVENYFVEGHMPVEVIANLLEGEPDIDGISLPGMPAGSPGMGGQKTKSGQCMRFEHLVNQESFKRFDDRGKQHCFSLTW